MNDRKIAETIHRVFYEVESQFSLYTPRDYISFEGMPDEYQTMILKAVNKLKELGVINDDKA